MAGREAARATHDDPGAAGAPRPAGRAHAGDVRPADLRAGGLPSGTIHPILARLEGLGWLESRWEDAIPREKGRPRRRYYRLSQDGAERARIALAQATTSVTALSLRPPPRPGADTSSSSLYGSDRSLARDLVRAGNLARDLDHARDLALLLASDPAIALDHARDVACILARDLDHACGLARAVARGVGSDPGRDLARDLARDLVDAVGLARDVDRACDRFPSQTSAPDHARDLARNLDHARELVLDPRQRSCDRPRPR